MSYSKVSWNYKDPNTTQKLGQMTDNSVWTSEHSIFGCQMDITGTASVQMQPGVMAIGENWLRETGVADITTLTADNAAHWEDGNGEGSATAWWVVAFQSGNGWNVLFRQSGPAYSDTNSSTANGIKIYDKTGSTWYRYIAQVWNNSGNTLDAMRSTLIPQKVINTWTNLTGAPSIRLSGATINTSGTGALNNQGEELFKLVIKPSNPYNRLYIETQANLIGVNGAGSWQPTLVLFQDAVATAIAGIRTSRAGEESNPPRLFYSTIADTAGSINFAVRGGDGGAPNDDCYLNAGTNGNAIFTDNSFYSYIKVEEIGR